MPLFSLPLKVVLQTTVYHNATWAYKLDGLLMPLFSLPLKVVLQTTVYHNATWAYKLDGLTLKPFLLKLIFQRQHTWLTGEIWRRDPESNRGRLICNQLHGHFAIPPDLL